MEAADTPDGGTAITCAVDAAAATTVCVVLAVDDSAAATEVVAVTTRDVIKITFMSITAATRDTWPSDFRITSRLRQSTRRV